MAALSICHYPLDGNGYRERKVQCKPTLEQEVCFLTGKVMYVVLGTSTKKSIAFQDYESVKELRKLYRKPFSD